MKKYQNNGHIIHHGDAIEILQSGVRDASIDLIFADPPYNIGKTFSDFEGRWPTDAAYAEWAYKWIDKYLSQSYREPSDERQLKLPSDDN